MRFHLSHQIFLILISLDQYYHLCHSLYHLSERLIKNFKPKEKVQVGFKLK